MQFRFSNKTGNKTFDEASYKYLIQYNDYTQRSLFQFILGNVGLVKYVIHPVFFAFMFNLSFGLEFNCNRARLKYYISS